MAFNHFIRFLMEHENPYDPKLPRQLSWGCAMFFVGPIVMATEYRIGLVLLALGFLGMAVPIIFSRKRSKWGVLVPPAELDEIWQLIRWIGQRRELNRRTHPELINLLEEIAKIRRTVLETFESEAWKARKKTPDGAKAIKDLEVVLRDALYDSVFIGRHLFRAKGQRESTFLKRCADPEFGRHSLERIAQIRDEMRSLSESALAAGGQSDLRVNLVKERLQAVLEAEREIEEISNFDSVD